MSNKRQMTLWIVYDWETRAKQVLFDPPPTADLRPSTAVYQVLVDLTRADPATTPKSQVTMVREDWATAPKRPPEMPLPHWIAWSIMCQSGDLVPPESYGPEKGPLRASYRDTDEAFITLPGEAPITIKVTQ